MDSQRIKSTLVLVMLITIIGGATYFITVKSMEKTIEAKAKAQAISDSKPVSVLVAKQDIIIGTGITEKNASDYVELKSIPGASAIEDGMTDTVKVVGKVVTTNIYKNQQISPKNLSAVTSKAIEPSDRYITVDIPTSNFVNNKVDVGSTVDILVDEGNGRYEVVIPKVVIYDKKTVEDKSNSSSSSKSSSDVQPARLNASITYSGQVQTDNLDSNGNKRIDSPAKNNTKDYRVMIKANEKEQKRLYLAMLAGKLTTRIYVSPETQPPSIVTFRSPIENSVAGDEPERPKQLIPVTATKPNQAQ